MLLTVLGEMKSYCEYRPYVSLDDIVVKSQYQSIRYHYVSFKVDNDAAILL